MPDINQIFFNHKELLELLIKKANVHEGKWMLAANFGFTAANLGPTPDQLAPGAMVALLQMGIAKAGPETPDFAILDAAKVNPATKSKEKPTPRKGKA